MGIARLRASLCHPPPLATIMTQIQGVVKQARLMVCSRVPRGLCLASVDAV
jgi:hypothetical protein